MAASWPSKRLAAVISRTLGALEFIIDAQNYQKLTTVIGNTAWIRACPLLL
jgi:hypothetical protein